MLFTLKANRNGRRKQVFNMLFPISFSSQLCVRESIPPYHLFCIVREDVSYNKDILGFLFLRHDISHTYIYTYIQSILNSRAAQLFHEVIVCARRIMLETYGLMTPMHTTFTKNNKAGSKGCVCLENSKMLY